ncbi:hypothetical protein NMG60_11001823 [Bertholletia excelsa]
MAASSSFPSWSSASCYQWTYDVFLSFSGEDTRFHFVDHLYSALHRRGIYTFKDDKELEKGKKISSGLVKAIEESMLSIVVISKRYASSSWCLDELVKIVECRRKLRQVLRPIFYLVDPSDVRKQRGKFGEYFEELASRNDADRAQGWRAALREACGGVGWLLDNTETW